VDGFTNPSRVTNWNHGLERFSTVFIELLCTHRTSHPEPLQFGPEQRQRLQRKPCARAVLYCVHRALMYTPDKSPRASAVRARTKVATSTEAMCSSGSLQCPQSCLYTPGNSHTEYLQHEQSGPVLNLSQLCAAGTLGSWVRIPLEIWIFVRCNLKKNRSRGSPVSMESGYGLDNRVIEVWFPAEAREIFSKHCDQFNSKGFWRWCIILDKTTFLDFVHRLRL
jgi:hypothetical protein